MGEEGKIFSISVNSYISFIFIFSPLPEEINEECDLLKEASFSELTYVQLKLNEKETKGINHLLSHMVSVG